MKLFIYGTDINTPQKAIAIQKVFHNDTNIIDISVDIEDIDNVLRIEATDVANELEVIRKVKNNGFNCVDLVDA